jgi:hypothetical protein
MAERVVHLGQWITGNWTLLIAIPTPEIKLPVIRPVFQTTSAWPFNGWVGAIAVVESPHVIDRTFVRTEGTNTVRAFLVVAGSFRVLHQEASAVPVIVVAAIDAGPVMSWDHEIGRIVGAGGERKGIGEYV